MDEGLGLICVGILAIAGYFLPTIIAVLRKHHNTVAIAVLNLLLGWTLLGWIGALVWSFTSTEPKTVTTTYIEQKSPPPAYVPPQNPPAPVSQPEPKELKAQEPAPDGPDEPQELE